MYRKALAISFIILFTSYICYQLFVSSLFQRVFIRTSTPVYREKFHDIRVSKAKPILVKENKEPLEKQEIITEEEEVEEPYIEDEEGEDEKSDLDQMTSGIDHVYHLKRNKRYDQAKEKLIKLVKADPTNDIYNMELVYILLREGEYSESIPYLLQAYEATGRDPEIALQIAYTYDRMKDEEKALEYYQIAADGEDPVIQKRAEEEIEVKEEAAAAANQEEKKEPSWFLDRNFLEFYADTVYYDRFTNWVFIVDSKIGFDLDCCNRHQAYVWFWHVKDTKSAGGTTPAIFTDNVMIVSLGYRYRLLKDKYAFLYANFGEAYDLVYRNRPLTRGDFRGGLYYYDRWEKWRQVPCNRSCYFQQVGDVDFNFTYYSRYRYWIGYLSWKEGINLLPCKETEFNIYCRQFLAFDTKGEFFNNVYEVGPVIEIYPYKRIPLKFLGGWIQGFYYRNSRVNPNPYGPRYNDLRFQAVVWTHF